MERFEEIEAQAKTSPSHFDALKEAVKRTMADPSLISSLSIKECLEAVSKILAEQDEETAEVDEAEVVGGMIFIADHQPPEVA